MGDGGQPAALAELRRKHAWLDRLIRAGARYQRRYGDYYAAAITYFSVLAMVPLLMIAFAVAGFVLRGNPDLLAQLQRSIATAVPNQELSGMLNRVINQAITQAGTVGIIGLLIALYSGLGWMTNLREALTAQWIQRPTPQPLARRYLSDLLSLLGLGVAMAISFGLSALGAGTGRMAFAVLGIAQTPLAAVALRVLTILLAVAAGWLVFLWVLARLPRQPVRIRSAVAGALVAAIGFEVLKQVGVIYLNTVTDSPAAAAFGPILGLLVFAYLTSRFIIFVTAWTASAEEPVETAEPASGVVVRPAVRAAGLPTPKVAVGLVGAGALLGWVLSVRRRR